jgi:hypothetical protein
LDGSGTVVVDVGLARAVSGDECFVRQYSTASSSYAVVDSYALAHTEPNTGDATSATLWLSSITHTAKDTTAGSSSTVPEKPVQFAGIGYENRVDTSTGWPGMTRFRLTSVTTETGGTIGITYGLPVACSDAYVEAETASTAYANTKSCMPVYWTPSSSTASTPTLDWFNQYAVTQVLETDTTGGSLVKETDYSYSGPAWHYDDDETVKPKYRTYGQWRGYQSVTTLVGTASDDPQTKTVTHYYQGMDGDWLSSTSSRSVSLTDNLGGSHTDSDQLAGDVLETEVYRGNSSAIDHLSINSYWVSAAVATRARTGLPALTANVTGIAEVYNGQQMTDGNESAWRYTETDTSYDATATDADFGLPLHVYSHSRPVLASYDRCTTTTYTAANTNANIVGLVGETETDSLPCSGFTEDAEPSQPSALNTLGAPTSMVYPTDVVKATETFYDGASSTSTAPSVGLPTETLTATDASSAGVFDWRTNAVMTYDTAARFSRMITSTDALGNETQTAYTLNSANLTTSTTTTNALNQTSSKTLDPERGLTLTSTDLNGIVATYWYDAMGRVIDEWDYSGATSATANKSYAYTQSNTGVSGTVEETLNAEGGTVPSVTIVDSLGRTRETQTATPQGGRMITDEVYNSLGNVDKKNNAYWDSSTLPTLALVTVADKDSANQDDYVYDGLGRQVEDVSKENGSVVSTSYTVYNGDATTTIPPTGGAWKTTVTDFLDRTSKVLTYSTDPALTVPSNTGTGVFYWSEPLEPDTWILDGRSSRGTSTRWHSTTAAGGTRRSSSATRSSWFVPARTARWRRSPRSWASPPRACATGSVRPGSTRARAGVAH